MRFMEKRPRTESSYYNSSTRMAYPIYDRVLSLHDPIIDAIIKSNNTYNFVFSHYLMTKNAHY